MINFENRWQEHKARVARGEPAPRLFRHGLVERGLHYLIDRYATTKTRLAVATLLFAPAYLIGHALLVMAVMHLWLAILYPFT